MKKLQDMVRGWFVGDFSPTALKTKACEVAYKEYKKGDTEDRHVHDVATEVTVIIKGTALMEGKEHSDGDILVLQPGQATNFKALTDISTVVVKVPGALNDKRLVPDDDINMENGT